MSGLVKLARAAFGTLLLTACAGANLQGVSKTDGKSDKKQEPEVPDEGQTAVPPEVVAGAYLTCGAMDPGSEDIAQGADLSAGELFGCMVLSRTEQKPIAVENYKTIWTILAGGGEPVPYTPVGLNPGSILSFAAILAKGFSANDVKATLGFPGSKVSVAQVSNKVGQEEGEAEMAPGSGGGANLPPVGTLPGETTAPPTVVQPAVETPCVTESENLKSQNGGCHFLSAGLVLGGINRDPSITSSTLTETQKKTMWYSEAVKICQDFNAGGFEDWRLPTKDELIAIQNGDLADKINFLQGEDGKQPVASLGGQAAGNGANLMTESTFGFWSSTKAAMSKRFACGIINKNCAEIHTGMTQQFSFCVRQAP